jgi:hypothetical protein
MPEPDPQPVANDGKSSADSWLGIQDARTRKTVQDRLAQRARRKDSLDLGTRCAIY